VRSEISRKAFEILTAEKDQFAEIMVHEHGKAYADALAGR
jgi:succinate-semialdehyde dehydrogenase/glutarate-semialdehyde dehydrogenase